MYLGMAPLDNSSGSYKGTKQACQVNKRARAAMTVATIRHIPQTEESKMYYDKKRREGKSYHQAVRAMGRHLVRVIKTLVELCRAVNAEIKIIVTPKEAKISGWLYQQEWFELL